MNLILFEPSECENELPLADPRSVHILEVLRRQVGESIDVGLVNGPRGKAVLLRCSPTGLEFDFAWAQPPPARDPLHVLVGLPRPQTARKLLFDSACLGLSSLTFYTSDKGEPSYAQSSLWKTGEWRRQLIAGAEQAFATSIPEVLWNQDLKNYLARLPIDASAFVLDNYESPIAFGSCAPKLSTPLYLIFGPERGFSTAERCLFRSSGLSFAHLGERVLRVETAVISAVAITKAKMGLM